MKLLTKTSLNYFLSSLVLLIIFGALLYLMLKKQVSAEIFEQLELETQIVAGELKEGHPVNHPFILVSKTDKAAAPRFRDTAFVDPVQNQLEGYYALTSTQTIKGNIYAITVITAYIGWDEYYKTIGITILGLIILLFGTAGLINYFISKQIWRPFLTNLQVLKRYSPSKDEELALTSSKITEFEDLNLVLNDFAKRSRNEYLALQEFTENSSHELQTPIAILRTRLESIGQRPLDQESIRYLNDARQAIDRLSKVNKSLLLLAKLRNGQFPDMQIVQLDKLLKHHIGQLEELYASRNLNVYSNIKSYQKQCSLYLLDILISNLLSNQIKYADADSLVSITLDQLMLEVSNDGPPLSFDEADLYKRFVKGRQGNTGAGLGLSIIKQICVLHQWDIGYRYQHGRHIFRVMFKQPQ